MDVSASVAASAEPCKPVSSGKAAVKLPANALWQNCRLFMEFSPLWRMFELRAPR
jgi:hypothetical protein